PPEYYADSAVVACRVPESEVPVAELQPKVTSSGGTFDAAALTDGDLVKTTALPSAPPGQPSWIQFEFSPPQTIHALTLMMQGAGNPFAQFGPGGASGQELQASDDGQEFRTVIKLPGGGALQHTLAFPKVTARYFRVSFAAPRAEPRIAELVLHTGARVN